MRKSVMAILLVVALLIPMHYCIAATAYDTYKADSQKAEEQLSKYEEENADLQAYLDAVESGNQDAWEAARSKSAVSSAIRLYGDMSEVDAVKKKIEMNNSMARVYRDRLNVAKHKADIYFHAYILQDTAAVDEFLANGFRTIPVDISGNIYYAWPSMDLPEGLFTNEAVYNQNCGNVFLATATILEETEKAVYLADVSGTQITVMIADEPVTIGETVNLYFTPYVMRTDGTVLIVAGAPEDSIDAYHSLRKDGE